MWRASRSSWSVKGFPRSLLDSLSKYVVGEKFAHWLLVLPALIPYLALHFLPVVGGLFFSFTDWTGLGLGNLRWYGFGNYARLFQDDLFWRSARTTFLFVLMVAPSQLILSVIAAVALNSKSRLANLAKTAVLVPIAMSPVSIGTLFGFLTSPSIGIPALLKGFGFTGKNVLLVPSGALASVSMVQVWASLGVNTFVFLAGLQAIPEEVYEAAQIDGAGAVTRFRTVTLPLLRETIIMNTIVTMIGTLKTFGMILVLTQGGPYHATEVLALYMYKKAFIQFQLGYSSAVAVVIFLVVALMTFVQMRVSRAGTTRYY
jgi:multiple sugar transport system permease protein